MNKDKKVQFLVKLEQTMRLYGSTGIKLTVGDSIFNHRTASVNQTIRFLKANRMPSLARRLSVAYSILKPSMAYNRKRGRRSDAYDLTEFRKTLMAFIAAEQVAKAVEYSI
jgi:hypothetical protein